MRPTRSPAFSVALDLPPPRIKKKLPLYPIAPAVLIGRLAVATKYRRRGLGRALIADAKDEGARAVYAAAGFFSVPDDLGRRMFLPMATALAAREAAKGDG